MLHRSTWSQAGFDVNTLTYYHHIDTQSCVITDLCSLANLMMATLRNQPSPLSKVDNARLKTLMPSMEDGTLQYYSNTVVYYTTLKTCITPCVQLY